MPEKPHSGTAPTPPPVDPSGRRDRAWLRREIVRQARPLRLVAAATAILPLSLVILSVVVRPAEMLNAFGLADEQTVTVVAASADDKAGTSRDRDGPRWTVRVSWEADGARHQATEVFRSHDAVVVGQDLAAVRVGDQVETHPSQPMTILLTLGALTALVALVVAFYLRRARRWYEVLSTAPDGPRLRARVVGRPSQHQERPARFLPTELGHLVPLVVGDPPTENDATTTRTLFVLRARHRWLLRAGDDVEVWTTGRVSALRRTTDGYWWLTAMDSRTLGSTPVD